MNMPNSFTRSPPYLPNSPNHLFKCSIHGAEKRALAESGNRSTTFCNISFKIVTSLSLFLRQYETQVSKWSLACHYFQIWNLVWLFSNLVGVLYIWRAHQKTISELKTHYGSITPSHPHGSSILTVFDWPIP